MVIQEKCILNSSIQIMLEKNKTINGRWFKEVINQKLEIVQLSLFELVLICFLMIFEAKSTITEKKLTKIFISTQQVLLK